LSLDSTTIPLCLTLFPWAHFRTTKGAVKLHMLLDHDEYLPSFACITDGKKDDRSVARGMSLAKDSIVAPLRLRTGARSPPLSGVSEDILGSITKLNESVHRVHSVCCVKKSKGMNASMRRSSPCGIA
jgi:hypothetical protein